MKKKLFYSDGYMPKIKDQDFGIDVDMEAYAEDDIEYNLDDTRDVDSEMPEGFTKRHDLKN